MSSRLLPLSGSVSAVPGVPGWRSRSNGARSPGQQRPHSPGNSGNSGLQHSDYFSACYFPDPASPLTELSPVSLSGSFCLALRLMRTLSVRASPPHQHSSRQRYNNILSAQSLTVF